VIALGFPDFGPVSLPRIILDGLPRPARVRAPIAGALPLNPRQPVTDVLAARIMEAFGR
jgi:hypothetical protein